MMNGQKNIKLFKLHHWTLFLTGISNSVGV